MLNAETLLLHYGHERLAIVPDETLWHFILLQILPAWLQIPMSFEHIHIQHVPRYQLYGEQKTMMPTRWQSVMYFTVQGAQQP